MLEKKDDVPGWHSVLRMFSLSVVLVQQLHWLQVRSNFSAHFKGFHITGVSGYHHSNEQKRHKGHEANDGDEHV